MQNHGERDGQQRNSDGNPRAEGVGLSEPPLQLVLSKQPIADTALFVPTGNPLAKFLVCHFAKLMSVKFVTHN